MTLMESTSTPAPPVLVIRADASSALGFGHIMRMTALAQAWHRCGGSAVFVCAEIPAVLERQLISGGFAVHRLSVEVGGEDDWQSLHAFCGAIRGASGTFLALDGYRFGSSYQSALKQRQWSMLVMDDCGQVDPATADYIVNQNPGSCTDPGRPALQTATLLNGSRYALLRKDFLRYAEWRREPRPEGRNVLVTFGGSDPLNVTPRVIEALAGMDLDLRVVIGSGNRNQDEVRESMRRHRNAFRSSEVSVDPPSMADLMAWADVAVAAAGSTAWELCFMGLPAVYLQMADNQESVIRAVAALGFGVALPGDPSEAVSRVAPAVSELLTDVCGRARHAGAGIETIDGFGASRICAQMRHEPEVALRRAAMDDAETIWEWSNDPITRAQSFQTDLIPWESHVSWYAQRLSDPFCRFWIGASSDGTSVGCVRFADSGDETLISINLAPRFRGQGIGRKLLELACRAYFRSAPGSVIRAVIKEGNSASVKTFLASDFRIVSRTIGAGVPALEMIRMRGAVAPF
jgi:UDP-2,4-diacetamido-2,4,6-trideoxy-beta-L-altropyranose hydrolase